MPAAHGVCEGVRKGLLVAAFTVPLAVVGQRALAGSAGYIQVKCGPGAKVFLDGTFKGITDKDIGGLIIENVSPGTHTIKVAKGGFATQTSSVSVKVGQVFVYRVKPFRPKIAIEQEGDEADKDLKRLVGVLEIHSLPVECTIDIPSCGITSAKKTKDLWRLRGVPAGTHRAVFRGLGKRTARRQPADTRSGAETSYQETMVTHAVTIRSGEATRLLVNLLKGEVVDLVEQETRRLLAAAVKDYDGKRYDAAISKLKTVLNRGRSNSEAHQYLRRAVEAKAKLPGTVVIQHSMGKWYYSGSMASRKTEVIVDPGTAASSTHRLRHKTPLTLTLPPGRHTIRLLFSIDWGGWLYESDSASIDVRPGGRHSLRASVLVQDRGTMRASIQ